MSRIAFIFHPYSDEAQLANMPFAKHVLASAAQVADEVDLFTWEPARGGSSGYAANVQVSHQRTPKWSRYWRIRAQYQAVWSSRFGKFRDYDLVIGVGQFGSFQAGRLAERQNIRWVYVCDEYPNPRWMNEFVLRHEKAYASKASAIIVPDRVRGRKGNGLSTAIDVEKDVPILESLNVPDTRSPESMDVHARYGIPRDKKIFLNAGTLNDSFAVPEILTTVPSWPEEAVLLLNSSSRGNAAKARAEYGHLHVEGRTFWAEGGLDEPELNSLVASCTASVGLFRPTDELMEDQGKGSGKLLRSIYFGRPVITCDQRSLRHVSEHRLGVLINHPMELGAAVTQVMQQESALQENCRTFARSHLDPTSWQPRIVELLQSMVRPPQKN